GLLLIWLALYRLVSSASRRLRLQAKQNEHLALHDTLTDLPNRTMFGRRLAEAIEEADADNPALAVMLLDLDRFKEINDTLGHHHGDELLRQLGPRLSEAVGENTTVARLGGDEFAILLLGTPLRESIVATAHQVLEALEQPFDVEGLELETRA